MQDHISDALDNMNKNIWKELRHLGLFPKTEDVLYGFSPDEFNADFAGVSVSHQESIETAADVIEAVKDNGFAFKSVSLDDVCAAVNHFSSQASGED